MGCVPFYVKLMTDFYTGTLAGSLGWVLFINICFFDIFLRILYFSKISIFIKNM